MVNKMTDGWREGGERDRDTLYTHVVHTLHYHNAQHQTGEEYNCSH